MTDETGRFFADDRGNVVDFYDGDELVARLDREVGEMPHTKSWDGFGEIEDFARSQGYGAEIDEADRC